MHVFVSKKLFIFLCGFLAKVTCEFLVCNREIFELEKRQNLLNFCSDQGEYLKITLTVPFPQSEFDILNQEKIILLFEDDL